MSPLVTLPSITTEQAREIAKQLRERLAAPLTPEEVVAALEGGDPPQRLLSFADLKPRKGIKHTRQWLGRLEARGEFPQRVRVGANSVAWVESEIDRWIESLPRGRIVDGRVERGREALGRRRKGAL